MCQWGLLVNRGSIGRLLLGLNTEAVNREQQGLNKQKENIYLYIYIYIEREI